MDLRSIKPGLSAVSMSHPFLIDPKTGEPLTALGVTKAGMLIWPVMGASPDDDSNDADADDAEESDEEDADEDADESEDDEADESDDEDDKDKKKKKNPQAKIKALEEEKDRHFRKAKKLAKEKAELEARLQALEQKDLKPEEKADRDKAATDAKEKAAQAATQKLRLENAFLKANEVAWVKPEQALALLLADDDYEVEFDEDGKVDRKSLRAELKRLAKANPHLVKPKPSKADDDDDSGDTGSQRQTAPKMNGQRKGKVKAASREELAKKFPALNRIS